LASHTVNQVARHLSNHAVNRQNELFHAWSLPEWVRHGLSDAFASFKILAWNVQ
jgi:hypothetical protein